MRIIEVQNKALFGADQVDPNAERPKQFAEGVRALAKSLAGRIANIEFRDRTTRISVASEKVHKGVIDYFTKHGVKTVEVQPLDEFFDQVVSENN